MKRGSGGGRGGVLGGREEVAEWSPVVILAPIRRRMADEGWWFEGYWEGVRRVLGGGSGGLTILLGPAIWSGGRVWGYSMRTRALTRAIWMTFSRGISKGAYSGFSDTRVMVWLEDPFLTRLMSTPCSVSMT